VLIQSADYVDTTHFTMANTPTTRSLEGPHTST